MSRRKISVYSPATKARNGRATQREFSQIRKLVNVIKEGQPSGSLHLCTAFNVACLVIIAILVSYIYVREDVQRSAFKNFYKQYGIIIHGNPNYCNAKYEPADTVRELGKRLVGQEAAISDLQNIFRENSLFLAIAFYGKTGVGKSKTAQIIYEMFYWKLTRNYIMWTKEFRLTNLLQKLSSCGINLIIIDGLKLDDTRDMMRINQDLFKYSTEDNNLRVIIIYVINNKQSPHALLDTHQLNDNNIKTVEFKQLDNIDLRKCIQMYSDELNIKLESKQLEELMPRLDVTKYGCKQIYSKLILH